MRAVLWLAVVVAAGLYIVGPIVDPDLWWHIVVGRWVIAHQSLPEVDYWTRFGAGTPWRAYSWLPELVFATVDRVGGVQGLLILKSVLAVSLSIALSLSLSKIAKNFFFGTLLGVFATAALVAHFTLRPQSITWGYFVLAIALAEVIAREGWSTKRLVMLALLMSAWANTHLTAVFGILAASAWGFERQGIKRSFEIGAVCLLGTLITPYFGGEWITLIETVRHPFSYVGVTEFKPTSIFESTTSFLVLIICLATVLIAKHPERTPIGRILGGFIFIAAGFGVVKLVPYATIYICAMVAAEIGISRKSGRLIGNVGEGLERLREFWGGIPSQGLAFVFICASVVLISRAFEHPLNTLVTPVQSVDFIEANHLPRPIMNTFGSGGYLMYRWSNEQGETTEKVAIDGRTNLITPDMWSKFSNALNGRPGWEKFIELLNPGTILWKWESPLIPILIAQGDWCLVSKTVLKDQGYAVLVKKAFFDQTPTLTWSENCKR